MLFQSEPSLAIVIPWLSDENFAEKYASHQDLNPSPLGQVRSRTYNLIARLTRLPWSRRECLFRSFNVVAMQPRGNMATQPQIQFLSTLIMAAWLSGCVAANIRGFQGPFLGGLLGVLRDVWDFQGLRSRGHAAMR